MPSTPSTAASRVDARVMSPTTASASAGSDAARSRARTRARVAYPRCSDSETACRPMLPVAPTIRTVNSDMRALSGFGDRSSEAFEGDGLGLGAAAPPGVERVDRGELVASQLEVEDVDVLGDPPGLGRLRNDGATLLQMPAQHHLRRALAVRLGDLADNRVLQRAAVIAVAVERDAADRRPRLRQDLMLGAE